MASCFSLFCQVNQQELPPEWRDDLNNNPGAKTGGMSTREELPRVPETAAIGHLHLSFEYHKTNLKIRVWQVSDLLLPPPQISMIESIFVRSYLIPDAAKKTNRKTEDVRVEAASKKDLPRNAPLQSGIQYIFTPSSFKFETPLLYTGVTKAIVTERSVRLEVCMTQKHTRRAFLMAIVHMPLAVAVRRPIRERYPLIPCMNYTIPNNMRVYSARDIILEGAGSHQEGQTPISKSNTSSSRQGTGLPSKFVSLDLSDSDDEAGEVAGVLEIQTSFSPVKKPLSLPASKSPAYSSRSHKDAGLREVVTSKPRRSSRNVYIDMSEQDGGDTPSVKKKIIPNEIIVVSADEDESVKVSLDTEDSDDSESIDIGDVSVQRLNEAPPSTVVEVGHLQDEAVVDITSLQGDVVIELDSGRAGTNDDESLAEEVLAGSAARKKKIMPPSELLTRTAQKLTSEAERLGSPDEGISLSSGESGCVYDDIASDQRSQGRVDAPDGGCSAGGGQQEGDVCGSKEEGNNSTAASKGEDSLSTAKEDTPSTIKLPRARSSSGLRSGSEVSSTTTSRPETPVWDFYDFTDEVPGEGEPVEGGGSEGGDGGGSDGGDAASKALGTLQESILRLSRSTRLGQVAGDSKVLETERVAGPVLPVVMIEDFEEMEAAVEQETEELSEPVEGEKEVEGQKKEGEES